MTAPCEIELKLETDADGLAELRQHPLLQEQRAKTVNQATTYFDTPRGALKQAGLTLRVRAAHGRFVQTVKQQNGAGAGLFARPEWEHSIAGPEPSKEALKDTPAAAIVADKQLHPILRSEARRSIWELKRNDCAFEMVIDEGKVAAGEAEEPIAEVEIELKGGAPRALFDFGRELAQTAALRIGVLSKAERGQRLADGRAGKPAKAERIFLSPDMTVAEGFAAIVHSCLRQFRLNEGLVMAHHDAGALHQARVAMRRLRSAFSLFRAVIDDDAYPALRDELRWFTAQLGDARNLDVLLKRVSADKEAAGLAPLLKEARVGAYELTLSALHSRRLRLMLLDIVAWADTGDWRERKRAHRPLGAFATRALDKRWRKVEERAEALDEADADTRHRLRIEVKKLRYACEFFSSLEEDERTRISQKRFIAILEDLQEELGELNDRETARRIFHALLHKEHRDLDETAKRFTDSGPGSDKLLREAGKAAERLLDAGPFWH